MDSYAGPGCNWAILKQHVVGGTLKTTYSDGRQVIKEYLRLHFPGDLRRPWKREVNALVRLKQFGIPAPEFQGFERQDSRAVIYRREFIPGRKLSILFHDQINPLTEYIAAIHEAGVILCDPSIDNLIITADCMFMFIDYCQARTFPFKGLLFYWYVGKEIARIYCGLLKDDPTKWKTFRKRYQEVAKYRPTAWFLVSLSEKYWFQRWDLVSFGQNSK